MRNTQGQKLALAVLLALAAPGFGLAQDAKTVDPYDQAGVPLEVDTDNPKLTKIVLIAGRASHGPGDHEFFAGTTILMNMLKQTPGIHPVMARDGWPKNEKIFENAKAVVFYLDGRGGHPLAKPERMALVQKLIDQGAGFVNLHYAVDYQPKQGETILGWMGGYYDAAISTNPHWDADFRSLPEHPIVRGVKPFKLRDEWYYNMRFLEGMKNVTPILRAVPPDNTRGTADAKKYLGREEIVAWTYDRPNGGRGFGFTGGHTHKNWGHEDFRRLVVNAILWSAKVEVPKDGAKVEFDPADLNKNLDRKGKK